MKLFKTTAFAAAMTLTGAGMSHAQDLRLLAGWDSSYAAVGEVLMPFIAAIEDATTADIDINVMGPETCLLYTSPSPRDKRQSRMPSSA